MRQQRKAMIALWVSGTLAGAAGSCGPTGPVVSKGTGNAIGYCSRVHDLPVEIQRSDDESLRTAAAADACHLSPLSDLSELPPDLANAGCTAFGSYQLGLGQKSARYAICPAVNGNCVNPERHLRVPCNPEVRRFVDAFKGETGAYGFAHLVTTVCDACLGSSVPEGMLIVAWHDRLHCPLDAMVHDIAIENAANVPAPVGSAGKPGTCSPHTTCLGGCMIVGPPPGI